MNFFQIDPSFAMDMHWLQTTTRWDVFKPHTFCDSHVLIYSLNTISLLLHKNDIFSYYNFKTIDILCLNETHFNTLTFNNTRILIQEDILWQCKWSNWYNDYIWQFHNLIITWNFYWRAPWSRSEPTWGFTKCQVAESWDQGHAPSFQL